MAGLLRITDSVITGDCLRQQHGDEDEVLVPSRAIVTPTGWDYIRDHRLRVQRDEPGRERCANSSLSSVSSPSDPSSIPEVLPASADGASIRQLGRFDHPDRPFGCKNDDFGSGFADPGSRQECDATRTSAMPPVAGQDAAFEALVQQITDIIMKQLEAR